jgi:penicillin-binding protein 1A
MLLILTGWYATELPALVQNIKFEHKTAVTLNDMDGGQIARYGELRGESVTVADLPPYLIYAVLATEDRRFYEHHGVDPVGMMRAFAVNIVKGHLTQGGSTITQQLAKNLFLSHERTVKRKIQEALLALWLEHELTKDEILSAYLNRVYMGSGAYGVDAAAQTYFNKPAKDVTLYEAAMLAGLLKAPARYSPQSNPGLAAKRALVVLAAMKDAGYITAKEEKAVAARSMPTPGKKPGEGKASRYFADWAMGELDGLVGTSDADMTIQTTMNRNIQNEAEAALAKALRENANRNVTQGAIMVVRRDGAVRAMVGGRNYTVSQFNRAIQARRPPGSSFKPFVYLTALEAGWLPTDTIDDTPITDGKYRPENFDKEYGGPEVTLEDALAHSLNAGTVRLARQVGIDNVVATAQRAGIDADMPHELSLALGSPGIPLIEMITAYEVFSNSGRKHELYGIENISGPGGAVLYQRAPDYGEQIFTPSVISQLDGMLAKVITEGTGVRAQLPVPAAGKTGTSQDFRDAWFIGCAGDYVAAVWLGNDDNSPMKGVTGGTLPADVWRDVMTVALQEQDREKSRYYSYPQNASGDGFSGLIRRILFTNQ